MTNPWKPAGYPDVSPYLIADGAQRVMDFLAAAFDATPLRRFEGENGTVHHAEMRVGDAVVMMGDAAPPQWPAVPQHVHVYVADVDATYRKALAAGGTSVQEPTRKGDQDKRGGVRDPAGNTWWIATQQ